MSTQGNLLSFWYFWMNFTLFWCKYTILHVSPGGYPQLHFIMKVKNMIFQTTPWCWLVLTKIARMSNSFMNWKDMVLQRRGFIVFLLTTWNGALYFYIRVLLLNMDLNIRQVHAFVFTVATRIYISSFSTNKDWPPPYQESVWLLGLLVSIISY